MTTQNMPVNTSKVANRRKLRFNSIDDALAEVDRLVAAERAGRLVRLGNWSTGQLLGHLATWGEYSYTGAPLKVPFFVKWAMKLMKRRLLETGMPPGRKIPRIKGGTLGWEPMSLDQGEQRFRSAYLRLKNEKPTQRHALFGELTHEQWVALNLRHAELHLGFLIPQ